MARVNYLLALILLVTNIWVSTLVKSNIQSLNNINNPIRENINENTNTSSKISLFDVVWNTLSTIIKIYLINNVNNSVIYYVYDWKDIIWNLWNNNKISQNTIKNTNNLTEKRNDNKLKKENNFKNYVKKEKKKSEKSEAITLNNSSNSVKDNALKWSLLFYDKNFVACLSSPYFTEWAYDSDWRNRKKVYLKFVNNWNWTWTLKSDASKVIRIICNNKKISDIRWIWNFKNLTTLNLWYNNISNLPSEIWRLSNLRKLVLSNNKLTSLPNEIWKLNNSHDFLRFDTKTYSDKVLDTDWDWVADATLYIKWDKNWKHLNIYTK